MGNMENTPIPWNITNPELEIKQFSTLGKIIKKNCLQCTLQTSHINETDKNKLELIRNNI
jgi:hypothetical protein